MRTEIVSNVARLSCEALNEASNIYPNSKHSVSHDFTSPRSCWTVIGVAFPRSNMTVTTAHRDKAKVLYLWELGAKTASRMDEQ
jgi:hypothetical protein